METNITDIVIWENQSDRTAVIYNSEKPGESFEVGAGKTVLRSMWVPWEGRGHLSVTTKKYLFCSWDGSDALYGHREGQQSDKVAEHKGRFKLVITGDGNIAITRVDSE